MTTEQRLARLERQNRWMRRIGAVAVAVAAAVFLVGQGKENPRVVEAEKFVLLDLEGRERAVLGVARIGRKKPHSAATLMFKDKQGARTAHLIGGSAPSLALERPESHVSLSVGVLGNPSLSWGWGRLGSMTGRILSVRMVNSDYPKMSFYNKAGNVIWQAPKD
jgi:hypothetical protein